LLINDCWLNEYKSKFSYYLLKLRNAHVVLQEFNTLRSLDYNIVLLILLFFLVLRMYVDATNILIFIFL